MVKQSIRGVILLGLTAWPMLAQAQPMGRPQLNAGTPKRIDVQKLLCPPGQTLRHGRCGRGGYKPNTHQPGRGRN